MFTRAHLVVHHRTFLFIVFLSICTLLLLLPSISSAQTRPDCTPGANGFVPLACAPATSKLGQLYASQGLGDYVNKLFLFSLTIGAIMAVVRLMWGGYLYMGSGDMWSSISAAKDVLRDTVLGLLLLLAIYLILFQINPCLLNLNVLQNISGQGAAACG